MYQDILSVFNEIKFCIKQNIIKLLQNRHYTVTMNNGLAKATILLTDDQVYDEQLSVNTKKSFIVAIDEGSWSIILFIFFSLSVLRVHSFSLQ